MTHGGRQGVGRVRGHGSVQFEHAFHHELHLGLFRVSRSNHGLLDLARCVFEDFRLGIHGAANGRAACLAQFQGAVRVAVDEDPFDGDFLGLILRNDGLHAAENFAQPGGKIDLAGADDAAGHVGQPGSRGIQYAKPGALRARVDAEHANGRDLRRAQFDSSLELAWP